MKIFNFPFGPYPQRVSIYLAEKKLPDFEVAWISDPGSQEWTSIKQLSPSGTLPLLIDDDGTVVGQSLAILEYLEDKYPTQDMRGKTIAARSRTRQLVNAFDEALTFFGLWARHGSRLGQGFVCASTEVAQICSERYFSQLQLIDRIAEGTEFLAGEQVTIADCVAMATLQYVSDFYDVPLPPSCPNLGRWRVRFSQRASSVSPAYPEEKRSVAHGLMARTDVHLPA